MDVVLPSSSPDDDVINDDCDFDGDYDEGMMSLLRQNPADVAQRLIAMIEVESRSHYRSSHNEGGCRSAVAATVETRAKVVHWLYECVDYLGLNRELVESAMSNVDRLLSSPSSSSSRVDRRRRLRRECEYGDVDDVEDDDLVDKALRDGSSYQLVALSSLFLVAKVAGSSSASPERPRRRGWRKGGVDKDGVHDVRDYAALSHGAHSAAEIASAERTILEGLGWRLSRPTSASIARHAMALFLNAAETSRSASSRSEASDLLRSIDRRIEASVSDYGVSISASPSAIAFASARGVLGSPSAVAAFGRAMARHGIVVVDASASAYPATAGHRNGDDSMRGGGGTGPVSEDGVGDNTKGPKPTAARPAAKVCFAVDPFVLSPTDGVRHRRRGRDHRAVVLAGGRHRSSSPGGRRDRRDCEEEGGVREGPSSFHSSTDALCESPRTRGVEGSEEANSAIEEEKEHSNGKGNDRHRGGRRRRRSRRSLASSSTSSPTGVDEMITVDPRRGGRREQRTSTSDARRHDTPRRSGGAAKMTMKSSTRIEICCGGADDRNTGKRSTETRGRRVPLEP